MSKQYNELRGQIEVEYIDYLYDLAHKDTDTVISESGRTKFYADMVYYVKEHEPSEGQIKALMKSGLKGLYECYLCNEYDILERTETAKRVLYRNMVEQRFEENQM